MMERWCGQIVALGKRHPKLCWPLTALLALLYAGMAAWEGAKSFGRWIAPRLRDLGAELAALGREAGAHLKETSTSIAAEMKRLRRRYQKECLPLVYTKGRAAFHAARKWCLARVDAAKVAVPVYLAQSKAFVGRVGHGVGGFVRHAADQLRADAPQYRRHAPRRAIAAALALVMCLGMLPVSAFGVEADCNHQHDGNCYRQELICGREETEGHTHGPDCYTDQPICGLEESASHTHTGDCYTETQTCTVDEHTHGDACYTDGELTCTVDEHTHDASCFTQKLTCGLDEAEGHVHSDACYTTEPVCGLEESEAHTHTEDCYTQVLDCQHVHDETCGGLEASAPQCTCGAVPDEDGTAVHDMDCPLYLAPALICETCGEEHETASCPVEAVRALIAALPTPEEIAVMPEEEREESGVYDALDVAYNAYDALREEQKALIPDAMGRFEALQEALTAPMLLAATGVSEWDGVTKDTNFYKSDTNTYQIQSAAQLAGLAKMVGQGNKYEGAKFYLTTNIDLKGYSWTPIGNSNAPFYGSFYGSGYSITGLNVQGGGSCRGLFGYVYGETSSITGLLVEGRVTGENSVGGIVGSASLIFELRNCASLVTVTATGQYVGGIVGYASFASNSRGIEDCYAAGSVTSTGESINAGGIGGIGGIVGLLENGSKMECCYAIGAVSGPKAVGGIVGKPDAYNATSSATVTSCVALNPEVTATTPGGAVGRVSGSTVSGLTNNKARVDMLVNTAAVTGGTSANQDGADVKVDGTAAANNYGVFSDYSTGAWEFPTNKLAVGEALPTLANFKAPQAPILPGVVTSVAVSPTTLPLDMGKTGTLTATVLPSAEGATVTWSSSDPAVAAVSGSGSTATVTAVAEGQATITATVGSKSASCTVTVSLAAMTGRVVAKSSLIYNGAAQTVFNIYDAPTGYTIKSGPSQNSLTDGIYKATAAGSGTVYYELSCAGYTTKTGSITYTITKKPLTVKLADSLTISKIYDGTTAVTGAGGLVVTGVVSGETVTADGTWAYEDKSVGDGKTVTVSGITLSGSTADNYSKSPSRLTTTGSITPRTLTHNVTVTKSKPYDGTVTAAAGGGLTNLVQSDAVTLDNAFAYNGADAGSGKTITATVWSITGADAGNYVLPAFAPITDAAITPKEVAVAWRADSSYTYTGADQSDTVTASYTDVNGAVIPLSVSFGGGAPFQNAGDYTATASQSTADGNYALTGATKALTIQKAARSIAAPKKADATSSSVTLSAVAASTGDGSVEYAKSDTSAAPTNGWQSGTTFDNLAADTSYYFFARVTEGTNYQAATSTGVQIKTLAKKITGLTITTSPTKTAYVAFDTLERGGMVVTASYDNGTTETITGYAVSYQDSRDSFRAGDTQATITFSGQSATQTVTVGKRPVAVPVIASKAYTGETLTAAVDTMGKPYAVTDNAGGTEVGSYDVVLTLSDTKNDKWPDSENADKTLSFSITQAENSWTTPFSCPDIVYGQVPAPVAAARFGTAAFAYAKEENGAYGTNTPDAAGTWYVKASVPGTGNYKDLESKLTLQVSAKAYGDGTAFTISDISAQAFTGSEIKPEPTIRFGEATLQKGVDYTLGYADNVNVGQAAKVTITFQGNFSGNAEKVFAIVSNPLPGGTTNGDVFQSYDPTVWNTSPSGVTIETQSGWTVSETAPVGNGTSVTFTDEGDGVAKTVYVKDKDGNTYQTTVTYRLDKTTPAAPGVSIKVGGDVFNLSTWKGEWTAKDVEITLTGTPTTSGHAKYQYSTNFDSTWQDMTGSMLIHSTNTPDAGVTYQFRAVNVAGTEGTASGSVLVKRRALDDSVLDSADNKYALDDVALAGTAGENGWYTDDVTVSVTKKDNLDGNSAKTYYTIDDGARTELTGSNISITSDGIHTLEIWTEDAAGNETTHLTVTYKLDKTTPTIADVTGNPTEWTKWDEKITFAAADGLSGVASVTVKRGETPYTVTDNSSFTADQNGDYVITVTDAAGNETTQTVSVTKIDKTAPEVTIATATQPNASGWFTSDVTVNVTVTDDKEASSLWSYSTNYTPNSYKFTNATGTSFTISKDGDYTNMVAVKGFDKAGNSTLSNLLTIKLDKTAPADPVVKIGGYAITEDTTEAFGKTIEITLTPTPGSPESYTYSASTGGGTGDLDGVKTLSVKAKDGKNTLTITLTDAAGNETKKTYTVNITTEVPDAPAIDVGDVPGADGTWSKGDVTITLPTGDKDYVYREKPDGDWKPIEDSKLVFDQDSDSGDYELAEKVTVDGKDYYGEATDITVKIDKTAPTIDSIVVNPGLSTPTNGNVVITVPVTDDGSGIASVTVTPSAGATVTGPVDGKYTVTVTENGSYTVTVTDNAGNSSITTQTVTGIDRTKPTVTITPETDSGKWYGKTEITVTAADPDGSGVAITVITVDGQTVSSPISITEQGEHTVVVTVTDKAGNTTTVTKTVNVDPAIDDFKDAVDALGQNPATEAVQKVLEDYLNLTDEERTHIQNSDAGKGAWDDLQDELKQQQDAIKEKIDGILDKENPTISDITAAEDLFDILDEEAQSQINKDKLDQLIKDRDTAQSVIDQIQNADTYEEQKAAVESYDRLTEDQKKLADGVLTPGAVEDMRADVGAVGEVIDLIDAVKKPYTSDTQDAIQSAKDAYDALDAEQKNLFPAYEKEKLDSLMEQLDHVKAVEEKINALTTPYTPGENDAVKAAQKAYDSLTTDEKTMVDKDLKAKLDELYKAMLDAIATGNAAVDKVIQDIIKVENDPNHTVEDIQRVEDAYNKLPQDAKDKVDETVVSTSPDTTAKDILDALVEDKEAVKDLVDDLNQLDPDQLIPGNVTDIGNAKDAYDDLTPDQKDLVDSSTGDKLEDLTQAVEDAKQAEDAIEKIPEHSQGSTNPDGTPDLEDCTNTSNAGENNQGIGGHTAAQHRKAIEDAKYAYEKLSDAGRKLIDPDVVTKLNNEYKALMSYLEYINRKEVPGAAVEVVGLAEKVDAPVPPSGGKTVVAVELKVEEPPAAIKPAVPEGKAQALSVDVKLVATKLGSDGTELSAQNVQPVSGEAVLVKLLLPTGYQLDTLEIVHVKDTGAQYPIHDFHLVTESDGTYAVFEVSSFSHFVFFAEKEAVPPTPPTPPTPDDDDHSGSDDHVSPAPKPAIPDADHGSVVVSPEHAKPGDKVTVTTKPDEGYVVDKITVTDQNGKNTPVKDNGDGTYSYTQPNGKVTITVTFKPASTGEQFPFTDVAESDWFYESVKYVFEAGLMNGTASDKFSPYLDTSRGMIVTILWRLEGAPDVAGANPFNDVASDSYCAAAVAWGAEKGIINGYANGNFGPTDPITREQLAAILYRFAQFKGMDTTAANDLTQFTDQPDPWAAEAVRWAVGNRIISGKGGGVLDPTGKATRAQAAAMLMRFLTNQEK